MDYGSFLLATATNWNVILSKRKECFMPPELLFDYATLLVIVLI